jgi:hypothetical protein
MRLNPKNSGGKNRSSWNGRTKARNRFSLRLVSQEELVARWGVTVEDRGDLGDSRPHHHDPLHCQGFVNRIQKLYEEASFAA